jgi:tetratricopeptide (TPR) repeat protein
MRMQLVTITLWCLASLQFVIRAGPSDSSARIQELFVEAQTEEQRGQLDAAVQKYQSILRLDARLAPAYNNLGRLYLQQSRYGEAIKVLKRALELQPNLVPTRALLGISLYQIGEYQMARQELKTALQLNPADRNAKLYLARSLFELEDFRLAAQLLEELQRDGPRDAQVLYGLGQAYMKLASSTLEQLQDLDPNSYLIEVLLGKTAEAKQAYTDAVEHYRKAISKAPSTPSLHYALGNTLWLSGQFPEALQEFRRELDLNPYDWMASWKAAHIILSQNPEEALRLSNRALELKPDLAQALLVRGRALLTLKRLNDAIKDFKKVAVLAPDEETVHYQLARAYRQLGLTEEAEAEETIFERMQKKALDAKHEKAENAR